MLPLAGSSSIGINRLGMLSNKKPVKFYIKGSIETRPGSMAKCWVFPTSDQRERSSQAAPFCYATLFLDIAAKPVILQSNLAVSGHGRCDRAL